jgi:hypothetical protein
VKYNHTIYTTILLILLILPNTSNATNYTRLISESIITSRIILSNNPPSCKEANLNLYIWFRSNNINPLIQIGTKNKQYHLWLEFNGMIFDATDPKYNGSLAKSTNEYVAIDFTEIK